MSLHLNTQRQQAVNQFEASIRSALPSLMQARPWVDGTDAPASVRGWLDYDDGGAAHEAQHPAIALSPQDVASAQSVATSEHFEFTDRVGNSFEAPDALFWLSLIRREGLPADELQPILQHSTIAIGFRASDQDLIERYANRQHLPQADAQWQYFDPTIVESLSNQRRLVPEAIAADADSQPGELPTATDDDAPNRTPEVAPGGGKYWAEDPNAAWW